MKTMVLTLLLAVISLTGRSQNLTAREVVSRADSKNRGLSSKGEMEMTVVRPGWSRTITFRYWSKGDEYGMILITAPPKEKGQVFLKRGSEMWNWVPSIEKMVKIPPSMMMQSWMGSDFTNDDLVKQSSILKDYSHKLLGKETVRGMECFRIELTPLPDAPVVWGKIISWITTEGFDFWKAEYYDEDLVIVNTENSFDIRNMGDRSLPTRMEIIPEDKKSQKTVMVIRNMVFNAPIDDSFFTQQNMKRVR